MDLKIKTMFEKIGFDKSYFSLFENAKLKSQVYNKDNKIFDICLELDNLVSPEVYNDLRNCLLVYLSKSDKDVKVALYFDLVNIPLVGHLAKDYIVFFLKSKDKTGDLEFIYHEPLRIHNGKITITYDIILVEDRLNQFAPQIEKFLRSVGFKDVKIACEYLEPEETVFDFEHDKEKMLATISKTKDASINKVEATSNNFGFKKQSFKNKNFVKVELDEINSNVVDIETTAKVFDVKMEGKSGKRYKFNITNFKTSYTVHAFSSKEHDSAFFESLLNKWVKITGTVSYNQFDKEEAIDLNTIEIVEVEEAKRVDDYTRKRVELHLHTNMSAMDGISSAADYVKQAAKFGHKAIAITDHVALQAFPEAQSTQKALKKEGIDIKIIYGCELNVAPHKLDNITNPSNISLKDSTYVFFDLETTGLSSEFDEIIEFGAVRQKGNEELDRIDILIKPSKPVSEFTTSLTGIDNEMLKGKPSLTEVLPIIKEFIGDSIIVAHNASFDIGFLTKAFGHKLTNPSIDTLPISRYLFDDLKSYRLGGVCRAKSIDYDEESAHRADYDAQVLRDLYINVLVEELEKIDVTTHDKLASLQSNNVTRKMHPYHINLLAKNAIGLKNLFKILSIANTDYFTSQALVPPSVIESYREGIMLGTSCARGEIFEIASTKSKEELKETLKWFDYVELQPLDQYELLVQLNKVESLDKVLKILNNIIEAADELNLPIVATGDCHYVNPDKHIAREVFISTPAIGGGYHPLFDYKHNVKSYPIQEFKTTKEMLDAFSYCKDRAEEFVIDNPNKIADMIDYIYPVKNDLYPPSIPNSDEQLRDKCYANAHALYGDVLPEIVVKRLERELNCIISNGYSIMYNIASLCIADSNAKGFIVGSRGSVGSSLAATFAKITEVNPLKPHYRCPSCKYSDFSVDETVYRSGFDLPNKNCPNCGHKLIGEGHNIPFETFLGFKGDKVPDIDLNFSSLNQADSHLFIKKMFGEDHVFRAGTIATAASKTAFGYAKKYFESLGKEIRNAEAARISLMCEGVKRTTGQHPGGLIVIPNAMDVYDFTPVGHPADDISSEWLTTHFDFHAIHDNVLKLDMLGHVDPTALRMLQNLTGINPETIDLNDKNVISMFNGDEFIDNDKLTSIGLPEFGTTVARKMLNDTNPTTFADLTKIAGLAHGTDVFFGNIRDLILNGSCNIVNCVGCRDDIMLYLIEKGLDPLESFTIMESVRKGKGLKDEWVEHMVSKNVPDWFMTACRKIKYLFPKAHAVAYCMMSERVAWFKYYYPIEYYATFFTWRVDAYDPEAMTKDINYLKKKYFEIKNKMDNNEPVSNKEDALFTFYQVAIEMYQRGFKFENYNIEKSMDVEFVVNKENNSLIPPFKTCDGIGENAARSVVEARKNGHFVSVEDLRRRSKLNDTNIKLLTKLKVLENLNESDPLTLF